MAILMAENSDYYSVLGVAKTANDAEIKSAYRKLALKWHPDRNPSNKAAAEAKFKEINEAYQVLSNTEKRQAYDQFGHSAFKNAGSGGNPFAGGWGAAGSGPFQWSYSTSGDGNPFGEINIDPFEVFESFFGGGFGFGGRPRRPHVQVTIEFMEAMDGAERKVKINNQERVVKIPAGIDDGMRIRFEDFDLIVRVRPDKRFKRDGQDLYLDQEVSYPTLVLGGTITVPTLHNSLNLKIRAGTASHTLVRIRGEGVQRVRSNGKGDLYVRLMVKIPSRLERNEKQLLEQLKVIAGD